MAQDTTKKKLVLTPKEIQAEHNRQVRARTERALKSLMRQLTQRPYEVATYSREVTSAMAEVIVQDLRAAGWSVSCQGPEGGRQTWQVRVWQEKSKP